MAYEAFFSDSNSHIPMKPFSTHEAAQEKLEELEANVRQDDYRRRLEGRKPAAPSKFEIVKVYGGFRVKQTIG